ncbi:CDP-glucose 4,6-dehydratase [Anaerotruncus massiliensis (ex Togo et al. 2019)]|nr:CDP-glucose 4,6-dehydratase [Anaerotruncus massiliensis (ex Togo et al. 2019)]
MKLDFYRGRRVLVTGHTGFKGAWLCGLLGLLGAETAGYALPPVEPSLYTVLGLERELRSVMGDIRDPDPLERLFDAFRPEVVFHLAAQPIVREGYRDPTGTFDVNLMGTVRLLDCVRRHPGVRSVLVVTTDKVYRNGGTGRPFREEDPLGGADPYAGSKSCAELAVRSYAESFFASGPAVSAARAGNVIGGGDFAPGRILPDCVRAVLSGEPVRLRHPGSVRPYQHVLEALCAYLLIAAAQEGDPALAGCYNVGPGAEGRVTTGELADLFCGAWGEGASWISAPDGGPPEADTLLLDCGKLEARLGWRPLWGIETAVEKTVEWTKCHAAGEGAADCARRQMAEYLRLFDGGDGGKA